MQITILTENTAGGAFLAEHGLSYLIEFNGKKILLDTGHSNVFLKNAKQLAIDLEKEVDVIVLSHGHWDHGNGLKYLSDKLLITHPLSFIKRYRKGENKNIGLDLSKEVLEKQFDLKTSDKPFYITDKIIFLGSIPRDNDFEAKTTPFENENRTPDFIPDDSALAFVRGDEFIVVTGCSHAGICNIIEYAKKVTGLSKVAGVIGGFHLKYHNKQTLQTIEYFKKESINSIYPAHCTALPALSAFYDAFQIEQVKSGMVIHL